MVLEAKLYRNTETFGEMDPFVLIKHNGVKYRTPVLQEAGKNPVWNHLLIIPVHGEHSLADEKLEITVFDEDLMMDDCVGLETF
jgi:Ca2+-dependent lipid-binding protein